MKASRTATPPPDATLPPPHPGAPAPGTELPPHYRHCYGCGDEHPTGLHVHVTVGEGLSVDSKFTVTDVHQGAGGLAHGGILATAIDESLGYLLWLVGQPAVTGRLEVEYVRPVPVGSTLSIHAEVIGVDGRKIYTKAEGRIGDDVAVRSAGLFIMVPPEHFVKHGWTDQGVLDEAAARWNPYNP